MKIILWIGNQAHQKALANKIMSVFPITGIVRENKRDNSKITVLILVEKLIEKVCLPSIGKAWRQMINHYDQLYKDYPNTQIIDVESINSETAFDFTNNLQPDLIVVSGTRLIKEKMLSLKPKIGILNLHTGLSPYIKGGPNCTNWCIATKQFHLIGNTIMWIDSGIDTGNIVASELTNFSGNESLSEIHLKVIEHAHSLYLRVISKTSSGQYSNIKQDSILKGRTYYTKQWTLKEKIKLVKNVSVFHKSIKSGEVEKLKNTVKTVKI